MTEVTAKTPDNNMTEVENNETEALKDFQLNYGFLINEFKFDGKTIKEWEDYFTIELPVDGTLIDYRICLTLAGNLAQEVYNYVNNFNLVSMKLEIDTEGLIQAEKARLLREIGTNGRAIAVSKAETMAREKYSKYLLQESLATMLKGFWIKMLEKVKMQIDVTKSLLMSEMARMKDDKFGVSGNANN